MPAGTIRGTPWTALEVEATVADYLHMLTQELAGQTYSKTAHRRALLQKLEQRTHAAVELKHQNISAVLEELGCPWIEGYKPRRNYQALLFDVVKRRIDNDLMFDRVACEASELSATAPLVPDFAAVMVEAPSRRNVAREQKATYLPQDRAIKRDYFALEARNRSLGLAGEEFIVAYERARLHAVGEQRLGDRVEHVAATRGDGLGYDILSFESNGKERFIEVKTTAFARETPFYVSRSEVAFSKDFATQYYLYRVFDFRRMPRMFNLTGNLSERCVLDPITFRASF